MCSSLSEIDQKVMVRNKTQSMQVRYWNIPRMEES
jgi:hypothetical protein